MSKGCGVSSNTTDSGRPRYKQATNSGTIPPILTTYHSDILKMLKHHAISVRKAACTSWIRTGMDTAGPACGATNAAGVETLTLVPGPGRARLLRVCRM